jgi:hypothetical protein
MIWSIHETTRPSVALRFSDHTLTAGTIAQLPVEFSATVPTAGLQFDVVYNSLLIEIAARPGAVLERSGAELNVAKLAPGAVRVLVSGTRKEVLASGTIVVLVIKVLPNATLRSSTISFFNSTAASPEGNGLSVTPHAGSVSVRGD